MTTINDIEHLINSNTNVVFTFGDVGAGKTTLIIALYLYLFRSVGVEINSHGNQEGLRYLKHWAAKLSNENKLPQLTVEGTVREVDWIFKLENKKAVFTFLDIAGENLNEVNYSKRQNTGGELSLDINKYLNCSELSIILLCIMYYRLRKVFRRQ
ncbi:MAG: hypothetical protein NTV43_03690 [Methylococcales bacterium]|nr:hypothetical protein [Methylococcales bacterium]